MQSDSLVGHKDIKRNHGDGYLITVLVSAVNGVYQVLTEGKKQGLPQPCEGVWRRGEDCRSAGAA